jgi:hypothetical protein
MDRRRSGTQHAIRPMVRDLKVSVAAEIALAIGFAGPW